MPQVSRRTVLSAAGASALAAALPQPQIAMGAPRVGNAHAAVTAIDALTANILARLTGTEETNAASAVQPKLTDMYQAAKKNLDQMLAEPEQALFDDLPLGSDEGNLSETYAKLYEIALATAMAVPEGATVPSDLYRNTEVRTTVIEGLRWVYDHYFQDQESGYYGNWYHWEIGIPMDVSRSLVLLREDLASLDPELATQYVASMDQYLRHGKNGDVDLDSRFHTGANLVDITTNRIVQGAAIEDSDRITKAIDDQLTAYHVIDPYELQHGVTDGFYADGSFIMHSSVAYTGSYGIGLLERATVTISLLDGTEYATHPELLGRLNQWLATSFAPVIAQGWMMEIVKGRAVSRPTSGYRNATTVVESVVALSRHASAESRADLAAYIAYLPSIPQMKIDPTSFDDPANIVRFVQIQQDEDVPARNLAPEAASFAYNAMDRNVHHRPGFTFALARSSDRVSKYEYMLGENLRPWFQGDGAQYFYLSGDDQSEAFGVDYFTVVDPNRLSGVTAPVQDRQTIPELYGQQFYENPAAGFTSSSVKQNLYVYFPLGTNPYSGGATLGPYATAAMQQSDDAAYVAKKAGELPEDFVVYPNSRSAKSWFMFDDEILVLASGITDEHGRATITTVDSRISDPADDVRIAGAASGRSSLTGPGRVTDLEWLHYTNRTRGTSMGYVFYTGNTIDVRLATVRRSRQFVRESNSDEVVTKTVFDLSQTRPAGAAAQSMAYAIVPGADARVMADYAASGPEILRHDEDVHAVRHGGLGLLAANTFTEGRHEVGALTVLDKASVLAQEAERGRTVIAVSDPTFQQETVTIAVRGRRAILDRSDPRIKARFQRGTTWIDIPTQHAYGASFTVTLRGHGIA